ncbi:MAG: hypothetical protein E4H13_11105 [Calditrichales bacterium]|nr:MAG: hypothetical protein E4H13_11105 [Calditrichales bacterium]
MHEKKLRAILINRHSIYLRLLCIIVILLCSSADINAENRQRPKVGLVLSGGGAKGLAHIGILKLLDSLLIPVDYIAGTSMGGIVGGLYAIGYSGIEIEELARSTSWPELFSDTPPREYLSFQQKQNDSRYQIVFGLNGFTPVPPSGFIYGQTISLKFSALTLSAEYIKNFDDFFIPFRCVAADLISGKEVVLKQGSLSKAMRATMSIPTIFSPVEWGDSLLVDGGVLNNLPVNVVREMGAEFIIAVDVGDYNTAPDELHSMLKVMEQTFNLPLQDHIEHQRSMSNLLIRPAIENFSASDFSPEATEQIIHIGENAADKFIDALTIAKYQYNLHRSGPQPEAIELSRPRIYGISITGNSTIHFKELYQLIGIKPSDTFIREDFLQRLAQLRASGRFESIDYEIRPIDTNVIRLNIRIQETNEPEIFGILVEGNERVPFKLIYNLLGFRPRDHLDINLLHQRIDELYGLGYFKTVDYEIIPVSENRVKVMIHVKEKPPNVLQIGFHYDNYYKLVGSIGLHFSNLLFPGLQMKTLLQFSGLINFDWRITYPMRAGIFNFFPYISLKFKDIPIQIYTWDGKAIAQYKDRSSSGGLGLQISLLRLGEIETGYENENMSVEPNIAYPDPLMFPSWSPKLRYFYGYLTMDNRDDPILTRSGFFLKARYEFSNKSFGSALNFERYDIDINHHTTFGKYHTIRIGGYYGWATKDIPVYKYFYTGGPNSFVGSDYQQMAASNLAYIRFDYRYEFKKDIFIKFITNFGRVFRHDYPVENVANIIEGYAMGLKFLSIVGPIELMFSRGYRGILKPIEYRNMIYVQAGFNL